MLLKSRKPVILVVNKVDSIGALPMEYYEFYELGFDGDPIPCRAHAPVGDLLDRVLELCPADEEPEVDDDYIRVAVIGKPNAGKSSIINKILGEDRLIVSDIPGTTRDAVDTKVENEFGKYIFIDTAESAVRARSRTESRSSASSALKWRSSAPTSASS